MFLSNGSMHCIRREYWLEGTIPINKPLLIPQTGAFLQERDMLLL